MSGETGMARLHGGDHGNGRHVPARHAWSSPVSEAATRALREGRHRPRPPGTNARRSGSGPGLMRIVAFRLEKSASQAIDVLEEIRRYVLPKRIEYELHALPSGRFCRRNEICIAGHQNDDIGLTLQSDRRYVEADSHIDAILAQGRLEVVIGKIVNRDAALQELLLWSFAQEPGTARIFPYFTQPHGKVGLAVQGIEEALPEARLTRACIADGAAANERMRFPCIRSSVVVERPVQEFEGIRKSVCFRSTGSGDDEPVGRLIGQPHRRRIHRHPAAPRANASGGIHHQ